jgi:glutaredoxin
VRVRAAVETAVRPYETHEILVPLSPLALAGWFLRLLLAAIVLLPAHAAAAPPVDEDRIEVFVREGCPHCAKAEEFLAQLQKERPALSISIRDVQKEPAALERLKELAQQTNTGTVRVPVLDRPARTRARPGPAMPRSRSPARKGRAPLKKSFRSRSSAGRSRSPTSACPRSRWRWGCSTASIPVRCGCCC